MSVRLTDVRLLVYPQTTYVTLCQHDLIATGFGAHSMPLEHIAVSQSPSPDQCGATSRIVATAAHNEVRTWSYADNGRYAVYGVG